VSFIDDKDGGVAPGPADPARGRRRALWAALERFFFAPVAPARPYLLIRGVLFLLAFDCWIGLTPRGAYYDGAFNVAHFPWLDAIQPTPDSALYITLVLGAGLLAFVMAMSRPSRLGMAALFAAYSYAWLMSMVDNYQHHYLISLLLFVLIFAPHRTAAELFDPLDRPQAPADGAAGRLNRTDRRRVERRASRARDEISLRRCPFPEAWAHVLFGLSCAIVYFYTAVTKLSPRWRSGEPLRTLGRTDFYRGWEASWVASGGNVKELWEMAAAGAIAAQLVACVAYVAATQQDRMQRRWLRVALALAMLAPLGFHLGTEGLSLNIGWFSYYMIWIALVFFLGAPVVEAMGRGLSFPARWIAARWQRIRVAQHDRRFATMALAVAVAAGTAATGHAMDLPGAPAATAMAAVALVVVAARRVQKGRVHAARAATLSTGLAALLAWGSIAHSQVRFDYYRTVGGAHRRQERWEAALLAYTKANRYAPAGQDRKEREAEARRQVEARRASGR
jgi:hypothetical protein